MAGSMTTASALAVLIVAAGTSFTCVTNSSAAVCTREGRGVGGGPRPVAYHRTALHAGGEARAHLPGRTQVPLRVHQRGEGVSTPAGEHHRAHIRGALARSAALCLCLSVSLL